LRRSIPVFGPFEGQSDSLTIQLARKLPLVGKPRVYVASSVSEVLDALEKTERPESAADQLLRELSHS